MKSLAGLVIAVASLATATFAHANGQHDFNGDGMADILWKHTDGRAAVWLMSGSTTLEQKEVMLAGLGWAPIGSGYFAAGCKTGILWEHTDGSSALWLMNGTAQVGGGRLFPGGSGWYAKFVADFNGDGKDDILWTHTDGRAALWIMDGATQVGGAVILPASTGWSPKLTADFNGDGKADIIWEHTDGRVAMWLMNGTVQAGGGVLLPAATNWHVKFIGDFNGDGKSDIVWENTDGSSALWIMNGFAQVGGGRLFPGGSGWFSMGTGDINGDGKDDVLWRKTDGSVAFWIMDGSTQIGGALVNGPGNVDALRAVARYIGLAAPTKSQWLQQATDGSVRWTQAPAGTAASVSSTEILGAVPGWTPIETSTNKRCAPVAVDPPPPACSDANTLCVGGPNSEFSTIQAAVNASQPGSTVLVFDGNWAGFTIPNNRSGTVANRLTVMANGTGAVINAPNASGEGITISNASYVTVQGFTMNGMGPSHGIATHGATSTSPMHGVTIRNNTVTNSQISNIYASNVADSLIEGNVLSGAVQEHGIYLANGGSDNTVIRNNRASNNTRNGIHLNGDLSVGGDGLHQNVTIDGNTFFGNTGNGMDIDGLSNGTIRNNLVYGNGNNAVRVFQIDAAAGAGNLKIYNNTLVTSGGAPIKLTADSGGHVIFNNILLNASTSSFALVTGNAAFVSDRNIVSGRFSRDEEGTSQTLAQWQAFGYDTSSFASTSSALFVNAAAGDYRLKPGSPAANAGIGVLSGVNAPPIDIVGTARPQGGTVDIGAYESF